MNNQGYPVLLYWEEIEFQGLMYKKHLISKFMSEIYCKSAVVLAFILLAYLIFQISLWVGASEESLGLDSKKLKVTSSFMRTCQMVLPSLSTITFTLRMLHPSQALDDKASCQRQPAPVQENWQGHSARYASLGRGRFLHWGGAGGPTRRGCTRHPGWSETSARWTFEEKAT